MAEQLDLAAPIPGTADLTNYRVTQINLNWAEAPDLAFVKVRLLADDGTHLSVTLSTGPAARAEMTALNKKDLTIKSLQRLVMERLISSGKVPGSISGSPD